MVTVVVRVDGDSRIGSGHVVRTLTLASVLRDRGAAVRFVMRRRPGHLADRVTAAGFDVVLLPEAVATSDRPTFGASPEKDAAETRAAMGWERVSLIVVDHYAADVRWERAMRPATERLLVIDDLADRVHDCDVQLDQNWFGPQTEERYDALVPPHAIRMLGPRFALLQSAYEALRLARRTSPPTDQRALIYFGNADRTDETSKALLALGAPELAGFAVDVVLGSNHPDPERVRRFAADRPATIVHGESPSLAKLMARASVVIGAGGATTWERLCLGVPSLVTTLAANQDAPTRALADAGYVTVVGRSETTTAASYRAAMAAQLRHDRKTGERPPLVDGRGTRRVAEVLVPTPTEGLGLRAATADDVGLFYEWRNDRAALAMSFDQTPVVWGSHVAWFERKLADPRTRMFVLDADGLPVGQVRLDAADERVTLSYALDAVVRGRGWGRWLVAHAVRAWPDVATREMVAEVRRGNAASCRIFETLGWLPCADASDRIVFRLPNTAGVDAGDGRLTRTHVRGPRIAPEEADAC